MPPIFTILVLTTVVAIVSVIKLTRCSVEVVMQMVEAEQEDLQGH